MSIRVHGIVDPRRVAGLAALTARQSITEQVFRMVDELDLVVVDLLPMDEYTIDVVIALPDGLHLVYDTT